MDALKAARWILKKCEGSTLAEFESDDTFRFAVERQLTIVSEAIIAARNLDSNIVGKITDLRGIAAFRNKLIHHYFGIRSNLTWEIVSIDLPVLAKELTDILISEDVSFPEPDW